jgi:heme exporter protein B
MLDQRSLPLAMLGKVLAHWSATGLLLSLFTPILCLAFGIPTDLIWVLFVGLVLGTPSLSLIGAIGAALTVTLHRGGVLIAIIVLPMYIPILIFGAGMLNHAANGGDIAGQIYALLAFLSLALSLSPFAIAGALRSTIN